ncbi:MAG: PIN domain-containing protein, partial [Candidatus Paceibacteria bacterium]
MKILLLDIFALLHRSYHALPKLTTLQGEPIGAVYGFTSVLLKALKELKPDVVISAIDLPGPTFRHREFTGYQATRPPTPKELAMQVDKIKELLKTLNIPVYAMPGYEADDVIGSIIEKMKAEKDIEIIILTGDLDALQLVSPNVHVYAIKKGVSEVKIYDEAEFKARFGFKPKYL